MSKTQFAQTIISKMNAAIGTDGGSYNNSSATTAMTALAQGITEYLIANTKVTVSYTGIIPGVPSVPDPIVVDTFQIMGACAPTGPSQDFDAWIRQIESNIIAGFQLAPLGQNGIAFVTKPFLAPGITVNKSMLTNNHDVNDEDPQQKIWEIICGSIMDWINTTAMNNVPGAAARASGPSTGTASITKITIT